MASLRSLASGAAVSAAAGLWPTDALAHAADRGHVLLLPTGHYLLGGASAVAVSFAVLAVVPPAPLLSAARRRLPLASLPTWPRLVGSTATFLLFAVLLLAGVFGSRDPLSNPLPLMVWTVFWIGLTLSQGLVGNVWWWIEPWYAPWRLLGRALRLRDPPWRLPGRVGYWPAVAQLFGFAWFELVYPAPDDPERLAWVAAIYFIVNLAAMLAFGHRAWSRRGECLSVFLRMVAHLGVIEGAEPHGRRRRVRLCLPGARLVDAPMLPTSGVAFLLLALAAVSFDGLMRTFFWLGLVGVNPLEFPGRSAVLWSSSAGLAATALLLGAAFVGAVALGHWLAGGRGAPMAAAGALVWSIVPISIAYHASHYLTALVVNGQYALAALSDPLMSGADLFGTAGLHVRAGTFLGAESAWLLWNTQAAFIVCGHVLAVLVAHAIAFRLHGDAARATWSQVPLALLMVGYTVFGLWLLSSPTGL